MPPDYSLGFYQISAFFVTVIGSWITQSKYKKTEFIDEAIFIAHIRLWSFIAVLLIIIAFLTVDFNYYCYETELYKALCPTYLIPIRWGYVLIALTFGPALYQYKTSVGLIEFLFFYANLFAILVFGVGLIESFEINLILFNLTSTRILLIAVVIILIGHVIILRFGSLALLKKQIRDGLLFFTWLLNLVLLIFFVVLIIFGLFR